MSELLGSNIEPKAEAPIPVRKAKGPKDVEETVRIILEENDEIPPTGLFLALNGRSFMIQPGLEVDVPKGVVEILDNAVTTVPSVDPQTKQIVGTRNRMRFPYRRVR